MTLRELCIELLNSRVSPIFWETLIEDYIKEDYEKHGKRQQDS